MATGITTSGVGIGKRVDLPFGVAVERAEAALASEGFGVLTRIDVQATLRQKIGAETTPFLILGACNPPLAHRALEAVPEIGLLLPCNLVVREVEGGQVQVEAINPTLMAQLYPTSAALSEVATEVRGRLLRVIEAV